VHLAQRGAGRKTLAVTARIRRDVEHVRYHARQSKKREYDKSFQHQSAPDEITPLVNELTFVELKR
jgi:hypothetical protein